MRYWDYRTTLEGRTEARFTREFLANHYCAAVFQPARAAKKRQVSQHKLNLGYRERKARAMAA